MDGGLREQNKARTRHRLVETALTLFEARGFDEVTVEEIADAALVSPRTFYRYFGSKEGVLFHDQELLLAVVRETITSHPPTEPPLAAVCAAVSVLARRSAADIALTQRRLRLSETTASLGVHRRADVQPRWEQAIAEALAERLGVDPDVDVRPRLLAGVGLAVMASVAQTMQGEAVVSDLEGLVVDRFAELAHLVAQPAAAPSAATDHPARTGTG